MNELVVSKVQTGKILTNYNEFKAELEKALQDYKGLVVTEENCSEMKKTRSTLTNSVKAIDTKRIEIKKQFVEPLTVFENECKEAISLIENVSTELKSMTDVFDEKTRQEKLDYARVCKEELSIKSTLNEKYLERIETDRSMFTLVATSKKKILEDITEQFSYQKICQDRELQNIDFVNNQIVSVSSLLELSTPLSLADVKHLIRDYEVLDTNSFSNELTSIAKRRKQAEVEAVEAEKRRVVAEQERKEAEQRRLEEQAALELARKQEIIEAETRTFPKLQDKTIKAEPIEELTDPVVENECFEKYYVTVKCNSAFELADLEEYLTDNFMDYEVK